MELNKKKYKQKEVIEIIDAYKIEYEAKLAEQKSRIFELSKENTALLCKVSKLEGKEQKVSSALVDAEVVADKIKERAELNYELEIERLRTFSTRWDEYFSFLKEKYPVYQPIKEAVNIKERLDKFLKKKRNSGDLDELESVLSLNDEKESKKFDPKSIISDYIVATESNGFNMDEVLNPGELQLEELCKELGLIE